MISQLNNLKINAEELKLDSIKGKIEQLQKEHQGLCQEAWKDLRTAIAEAIGAGLFIECPPLALLAAYQAVENFKSSAEQYSTAVDVKKEVHDLLKLERDLERSREFGGRER